MRSIPLALSGALILSLSGTNALAAALPQDDGPPARRRVIIERDRDNTARLDAIEARLMRIRNHLQSLIAGRDADHDDDDAAQHGGAILRLRSHAGDLRRELADRIGLEVHRSDAGDGADHAIILHPPHAEVEAGHEIHLELRLGSDGAGSGDGHTIRVAPRIEAVAPGRVQGRLRADAPPPPPPPPVPAVEIRERQERVDRPLRQRDVDVRMERPRVTDRASVDRDVQVRIQRPAVTDRAERAEVAPPPAPARRQGAAAQTDRARDAPPAQRRRAAARADQARQAEQGARQAQRQRQAVQGQQARDAQQAARQAQRDANAVQGARQAQQQVNDRQVQADRQATQQTDQNDADRFLEEMHQLDRIGGALSDRTLAALLAIKYIRENFSPHERITSLEGILKDTMGPPAVRNAAYISIIEACQEIGAESDAREFALQMIRDNTPRKPDSMR